MTTHDGADAEAKVEAMGDEELAEIRNGAPYSGTTIAELGRLLARLDAEAARAKAAEKERDAYQVVASTADRLLEEMAVDRGSSKEAALLRELLEDIANADAVRAALNVKGG